MQTENVYRSGRLRHVPVWCAALAALLVMTAAAPEGRNATMNETANPNIGTIFPTVAADSLAGEREEIPKSASGKITLVVVAFLRENQGQLDSWLEPFIARYGTRDDVTFYEVPMISSGYKFMRFVIDGGMRAGLPKEKHPHVVTMYGDVEHYLSALNLDPRFGYAFLLDREGTIRWQGRGRASEADLQALFARADALSR